MSAVKTVTLGILVSAAMSSAVRADVITWPSGIDWVAYNAGQDGSGAAAAAPAATTAAVASQPSALLATPTSSQSVLTNAPVVDTPSATAATAAAPTSSAPVDAFINLGAGPYPLASTITTGNAQPWYNSSELTSLFGGTPTASQIQSFDSTILARVQQTFSQSGVPVTLTDNPSVPAVHTLSLVSNTASASLSSAIGMTQIGSSGFSFIDKIAPAAQSIDQLEWIVAHNISHELMLAFGVPENYDQTGTYVDSKVASWAMMISPTATFSSAAAQAINQALAAQGGTSSATQLGAQVLTADASVPEPTTVALWTLAGAAVILYRRRRSGATNAATASL